MLDAIARHNNIVESVVSQHGGELFRRRGEGDSTFSVFAQPSSAVLAAIDLQRQLAGFTVVEGVELRTRVGIHSGDAVLFDGDYQGTTVNLCARIRSAANGGQIVTTEPVRASAKGVVFRDLGVYRLADVADEIKLYQPLAEGIDREFPPLRVPYSGNLPTPISPFIGRGPEVEAIKQLLQDNRLVTLTGLGGFGKTRLAIEATTQLAHRFSGGTWFVPVERGATTESLIGSFLQLVSRSPDRNQILQLHQLRDDRSYFVVLDNAEVALEQAKEFAKEVLTQLPNIRVLATSRELLHVSGEAVYPVPPMSLPSESNQGDAMALLVSHLRRSLARSNLGRMDFDRLSEVCRLTEGVPLCLELIAPHYRFLSETQVRERYATLLRQENAAVEPKHRSLETAIRSSLDMLAERDRYVLQGLAVFAGGFTLDAVEEVVADRVLERSDILPALGCLVDASLLQRIAGEDLRFNLLESVRTHALAELEPTRRAELETRHANWIAHLVSDRVQRISSPESAAVLSELLTEEKNIDLALDNLLREPCQPLAGELAADLALWWYRSNPRVGRSRLEEVLAHAERFEEALVQKLSNRLGVIAYEMEDIAVSQEWLRVASEIAKRRGDETALHAIEMNLGLTHQALEDYGEAIRLIRAAKSYFDCHGPKPYAVKATVSLGNSLVRGGHPDEATEVITQGLALAEEIDARESQTTSRINLAQLALLKQPADYEEARKNLMWTLDHGLHADPNNLAFTLIALALCVHDAGSQRLAVNLIGAGRAMHEFHGTRWSEFEVKTYSPLCDLILESAGEDGDRWISEGAAMDVENLRTALADLYR
ncbi:MAG: hypothetical protein HONBIEJF_01584 [Fimbriimonadaceae bacterium]|nr:hypothetical protein [Fimbriimonadaceae bacterium]